MRPEIKINLAVATPHAHGRNSTFACRSCTPGFGCVAQIAQPQPCQATPLQRWLWVRLIWLVAGFVTFSQPASAQLSVPGTPGVATQRAVVNFAELPQQEAGAEANPPPGPPPHRNDLDSPPLASSFQGFLKTSVDSITPDTHGAVGPSHVVASVNLRLRVQDRAGNILRTVSYADFWAPLATSADICCDHRVLYEPFDDRWIIVGQTSSGAPRPSMLLSVSQTGDPMGRWNLYRIAVADVDPAGQLWPDYPQIAFNKDWIVAQVKVVQGNFTLTLPQIYVFNKTNLYAGAPGLFTRFEQPHDRVDRVFAFPVLSFDHSLPTIYLLAQDAGPHGNGVVPGTTNITTLAQIYTINGAVGSEVLTEGPIVTVTNQWDFNPPGGFTTGNVNLNFAPQLGSSAKIAVFRAFIMGAVFRNGSLWAAQQVCLPAGGSSTRTAIQWWQLSPDGTILQLGMIDDPTGVNFYAWPSLSVNQFNDVLIGYSRFSSNQYASANYSFRYGTDPPNTLRNDTVFKAGEAPYYNSDGTRNRWGDYSATVVDPLNDTDLWTIQEYAASPANTWGTWWGRVAPSPAPLPLLLIDEPTITEGDFGTTNALFAVRLTHTNNQPVTVTFATANLTAQAGMDYNATNGTLTFAPGETNKIITVTVLGDLIEETIEAFQVMLNNPTNATLGIPFALGRIIDDDPVQIFIADVSVIEGDLGTTNALFTVRLSKSYHLPVSVDFATVNGTALAGSDYVGTNGTLNFAPGVTALTMIVPIIGDEFDETNKTFVVNFTNPVNAALVTTQAVATLVDDDPLALAIDDVAVREGDSGTANALFSVTLSKPYYLPVSVEFSTANGSALAGVDYSATNGTLIFAPGVMAQVISVAVNGDLTDEANKNWFLNLSNAFNVTLTDTRAVATIVDDDHPLVLTIPDISVLEGYNGTSEARFTVSLSKPMSVPVSVTFATANAEALAGSDYVSTNGTITFLPGETNHVIIVAVIGDALDELNESFVVNLTSPLNVTLTDTRAVATIVDDDEALISINDVAVREGQAGQTSAIFTVGLSTMSTRYVTVRASTANGSATAGADYLAFGNLQLSFPPGTTNQTVAVQVLGDSVAEPNETFRINLTSPDNGFMDAQGTGTILDDDFNIVASERLGTDLRLSFMTVAGWSYTVERTEDLSGTPVWTAVNGVEGVAGTGGVMSVVDPGAAGKSQRFYRVRLLP